MFNNPNLNSKFFIYQMLINKYYKYNKKLNGDKN